MSRVATQNDRNIFVELWSEFLVEHRKLGSFILPTERTLRHFLCLFDDYTQGRKIGVTTISDCDHAVGMWGTVTADGTSPYDSEYGHTAYGHGVYVRPDHRRKGLSLELWKRAEKSLRKRGIDAVVGSTIMANSDLRPMGEGRGFKPLQSVEIKVF